MKKSAAQFPVNHLPPFLLGEIAQAVVFARQAGHDIIDLSQLNPNLGPPPAAVEKLVQACLQPHNHRYSSSHGISKLRAAIAERYARRWGVELDTDEEVVITLGAKQALSHLMFAVSTPGDSILLPTPAYPIHTAIIALSAAHSISVALPASGGGLLSSESEDFFLRLQSAFESTWPRPMMMVVSFPHNPTAAVVTPCFFQRLVDFALGNGIYLIHDFAYADLAYDDYRTPSILQAKGAKDIAVECYSFSKGLTMPGWRIAACVGNRDLSAALRKIKSYLDCGVFQPLQIGAIKALESAETQLPETVDTYKCRRDVLVSGLRGIGFELDVPQGGLFVWARLPEKLAAEGSLRWSRRFLDEARVAVCPGAGFDTHAGDFLRFALMEPEARIRTAIARIGELIGGGS